MYSFFHLFLLFMIYSAIGYIIEVGTILISFKKLSFHRGFLLGPYLPIFGIGGVLMNILLQKYLDDPFALFCMAMIICSIVEYFSSLILEKVFKLRWWDYKDKKFNIDGRICLENAIMFGLFGLIFYKYINPLIINYLDSINPITLTTIGLIIFIIFLADLLFTINVLLQIKIDYNKYLKKDATIVVKKQMREKLHDEVIGITHIFKSFPKISSNNNHFNKFKELFFEVKEEKDKKK